MFRPVTKMYEGLYETTKVWEQGSDRTLSLVARHYHFILNEFNLALVRNATRPNARIIAECIRLEADKKALEGLVLFLADQLGLEIVL